MSWYCTQMWKKLHSYLHSNSKLSLLHSFTHTYKHTQKWAYIALKCEKNDTLICTQIPNILYCTHFFLHSNIGNCRETLWSNLITGRIIHQGKKAAKDVLQRFVCLMLSTFPFCTTAENVFFLESHSKGCFPPFFSFFVRHPKNSFLFIGKKNRKKFFIDVPLS